MRKRLWFNLKHYGKISTLLFCFALAVGCSPVRRLKNGDYLLTKNKVLGNNSEISSTELLTYVKQKPNRKVLGIWRFHLQMYNLPNPERFIPRYEARIEKRRALNQDRLAKNKKPKKDNPFSLAKWARSIGEFPVLIDSIQTHRSAKQLEQYLSNHGYFHAKVKDSIVYSPNHKRAEVFYIVSAGEPYRYKSISYEIEDRILYELYMQSWGLSVLRKGNAFNADLLEAERDRIQSLFRNEGFFAFVKNEISFVADTSELRKEIDLHLVIDNPIERVVGFVDSTVEKKHIRYRIDHIYLTSDYSLQNDTIDAGDTLFYNNYQFISSKGLLKFKPRSIKPTLDFKHGDLYSKKRADHTYSRIAELNAFRFININFTPSGPDSLGLLDANIRLSPRPRHSITYQTQGTNTAGNFGVAADVIYQNRNLFTGLELFEFRLTGGLEVQRILGDADNSESDNVSTLLPFNTLLFGPQVSLSLPKSPDIVKFLGSESRRTQVASFFNYQRRPDYTRSIFTSVFGFSARSNQRVRYTLNPAEINFVTVNLSSQFENLLNASNNLFLKNSFKSQFIALGKFSRTYNSQVLGKSKSVSFFQWNIESAGILMGASRKLFANPAKEDDKYIVFGVPYSQFLRFDSDYRFYRYFSKSSSLAFRSITGLGLPYGNSEVMPFEKSFFVGGANGLRAWIARSLGPGSYKDSSGFRIDQIGDIKLEWNLELRQKLYQIFETAVFIDAGNIWLRQEDPLRPMASFALDRFYREIAIGAGIGLRLNFDFFIIRLDAAHPLRDPSFPIGERWAFNRLKTRTINFNFGIGYPF